MAWGVAWRGAWGVGRGACGRVACGVAWWWWWCVVAWWRGGVVGRGVACGVAWRVAWRVACGVAWRGVAVVVVVVQTRCNDEMFIHDAARDAPNYGGPVPVDTGAGPVPVYRA